MAKPEQITYSDTLVHSDGSRVIVSINYSNASFPDDGKPVVIYHDRCPDGVVAAWCIAQAYPNKGPATAGPMSWADGVHLHAANHGDLPPIVDGKDVIIVDFSYPRPVLEDMAKRARSLVVYDHHKTAEEDLRGLPFATFDMNRSGAGLAWDYFHAGLPRPWIVDAVEDRDLWRWALHTTKPLSAYLRAKGLDINTVNDLARISERAAVQIGMGAQMMLDGISDRLAEPYTLSVKGIEMPVINCPGYLTSETLHDTLQKSGMPIAMAWHRNKHGYVQLSFRSIPEVDCSAVAKLFGGGGHKNAAGARLDADSPQALALLLGKEVV